MDKELVEQLDEFVSKTTEFFEYFRNMLKIAFYRNTYFSAIGMGFGISENLKNEQPNIEDCKNDEELISRSTKYAEEYYNKFFIKFTKENISDKSEMLKNSVNYAKSTTTNNLTGMKKISSAFTLGVDMANDYKVIVETVEEVLKFLRKKAKAIDKSENIYSLREILNNLNSLVKQFNGKYHYKLAEFDNLTNIVMDKLATNVGGFLSIYDILFKAFQKEEALNKDKEKVRRIEVFQKEEDKRIIDLAHSTQDEILEISNCLSGIENVCAQNLAINLMFMQNELANQYRDFENNPLCAFEYNSRLQNEVIGAAKKEAERLLKIVDNGIADIETVLLEQPPYMLREYFNKLEIRVKRLKNLQVKNDNFKDYILSVVEKYNKLCKIYDYIEEMKLNNYNPEIDRFSK